LDPCCASGERTQQFARRPFPPQQVVQALENGVGCESLQHGRPPMAQFSCWIPASSQPLEPSIGRDRFQTSSKRSSSPLTFKFPENRTLARYSPAAVSIASRLAVSSITSVRLGPARTRSSCASALNISSVVHSSS